MALSITQLSQYLTGRDFIPSKGNNRRQTEEMHQDLPSNGLTCLSVVSYVLKFCSSTDREQVFHTEEMNQDLPWNGLSCLSVVSYVLKFCSSTDHEDVFQTIKRLDVLASEINKATPGDWEVVEMERDFAETFVETFMPKVEMFFMVPEPGNNTHLAAFLHFLLQVLNSESEHIHLRQRLSFFLAVLGDTMFRYAELEEVKNLLTGFKAMANEAGGFVYSGVFHTSPDNITRLRVEKIDFLNEEIRKACIKFQELNLPADPKNTDAADALLVVNSLLEDLETFVIPRVDLINGVKDQVRKLHIELVSAQSFIKDINALREIEAVQLKECIIQIREASCEADYLVNSFVVGNFPQWYLAIRIPNVIQRLQLIGKRFNGIKTARGINVQKSENDPSSQATYVAVDDIFVGFKTETQYIMGKLVSGSSDLETISVYGMPALGKTTFARNLYNHRATTEHFDLSAWCVVSQTYQRRRVLLDILMGLRKLHSSDEIVKMEDHVLIEDIYKTLKGRRFFIIMDDVWDTDCLDDARMFCPNDSNGSRILFTTRNQETTVNSKVRLELPSPTHGELDIFVGFETETQDILGKLVSGSSDLQTISVYGMPGLGKTTFARNLYNHRATTEHFDLSAWCVVSQTYQRRRVLLDILMGLRKLHSSDEIMNMKDHMLIEHIYKTLKGRRFFIILDDVWDTDCLDDARIFCPNDRNGSRILFTTRNQGTIVNSIVRSTLPYLTHDQCWDLLEKKVFHYKRCPGELVNYGKQIAKKCCGLPLTVVVIAGILASMPREKKEWRKVQNSIKTYTRDSMEKVLELSYKHLPNHLKLCFLCFGLFPEDAQIDVQKLICSWIAEGFIQKDDHISQEHLAREYLKHLVERSLVQVTKYGSTGNAKACSIHDELREMCKERAKKENFMSFIDGDDMSIYERHLRLSVSPTTPKSLRPFSVHCRSFYGNLSDPSSCLPQMKHLRVMQLRPNEGVNISYKLKRIDMLVHLKYLVVDRMPQVKLDHLVNLEILVVDTEFNTVSVPSSILKMDKLRHLRVKRYAEFENDCDSSEPNNLQYLSFMSIHSSNDYKILASSRHLRKLKCLCPPQLPDFRFLSKLESLKIMIRNTSTVPKAMEIKFPLTITKLSLFSTRLPWEMMSIIGKLPKLQSLKLLWKAFVGKQWETTEDEFQTLVFLKLDGLKLEQWSTSSSNFPILEHLVLSKCDDLLDIPLEIGEVPTLKTIEVRDCSKSASKSASEIERQQVEFGNTELKFVTTK